MKCCLLASATKLRRLCFYTCLSFCSRGGGVCLSACWDTTPWTRRPPGSRHPLDQAPPEQTPPPRSRHPARSRHTTWDQTPSRPSTPPSGSRHPRTRHTPQDQACTPQQTATVADGTHPTGMHSCLALMYFYRPPTKLWEGNVFTGVYHSVEGGVGVPCDHCA